MNKKARPKSEEIDKKILEYLSKVPLTATTEMVAKKLGIAWYTAQMHLFVLKDKGTVKMYRIGRQNQWILSSRVEKMEKTK